MSVEINASTVKINSTFGGGSCGGDISTSTVKKPASDEETNTTKKSLRFIRDQIGVIEVVCGNGVLIEGDIFEGRVEIIVTSGKSQLEIPSTGRIKVRVIS